MCTRKPYEVTRQESYQIVATQIVCVCVFFLPWMYDRVRTPKYVASRALICSACFVLVAFFLSSFADLLWLSSLRTFSASIFRFESVRNFICSLLCSHTHILCSSFSPRPLYAERARADSIVFPFYLCVKCSCDWISFSLDLILLRYMVLLLPFDAFEYQLLIPTLEGAGCVYLCICLFVSFVERRLLPFHSCDL